jgi:release factor glutamine methyltransferase
VSQSEKAKDVWTVKDVLSWTSQRFQDVGTDTPLLDAQLLIGAVLNLSKVQLYMHYDRPLSSDERSQMRTLVQRRIVGEPVAYLLGQKFWHTLDLAVDKRVLIPRPETETLLDFVLMCWEKSVHNPRVIVDICTGSGCLGIALAKKFPESKVIGLDCSEDALVVARENAARNNVHNIEFRRGDVFEKDFMKLLVSELGLVDIVVANPPYVTEQEWRECAAGVRDFEPKLALVSDEAGLAHGKVIAGAMKENVMAQHSVFAMELAPQGPSQLVRLMNLTSKEDVSAYSFHTPVWDIPRGEWFALRDLEARPRFLCHVLGLHERCFEPVGDGDANLLESDATLANEL